MYRELNFVSFISCFFSRLFYNVVILAWIRRVHSANKHSNKRIDRWSMFFLALFGHIFCCHLNFFPSLDIVMMQSMRMVSVNSSRNPAHQQNIFNWRQYNNNSTEDTAAHAAPGGLTNQWMINCCIADVESCVLHVASGQYVHGLYMLLSNG